MNPNASTRCVRITLTLTPILTLPATAFAYVGPGAGLSVIGSLLAFFAAIIVGVFGFLWFPIRRLLRKRKQAAERKSEETELDSAESVDDADVYEVKRGDSEA